MDFDNKNNLDRFVVRPSCPLTGRRIGARPYRAIDRSHIYSHSSRATYSCSLIAIQDKAGRVLDIKSRGETRARPAVAEQSPFASSLTEFIDKNLMAFAAAITRDRRREA